MDCSIEDCGTAAFARGWCKKHYTRFLRHGDPRHPSWTDRSVEQRFWEKVDFSGSCWGWMGPRSKGYGRFGIGGKVVLAHRFARELLGVPAPADLCLDHLCRNKACVNPDHTEPVTLAENTRRAGFKKGMRTVIGDSHLAKTHCKRGHPYDDKNTCITPDGWRRCRECGRLAVQRHRARKEANQ